MDNRKDKHETTLKSLSRRQSLKVAGTMATAMAVPSLAAHIIQAKSDDIVRLGFVFPFTGRLASYGESTWPGVKFAVEQINKAGGIRSLGGAKLKVLKADGQGNPKIASSEIERLINREKISGLIGVFSSTQAISLGTLADQYQIPFISPSWTSPKAFAIGSTYSRTLNLTGDSFGTGGVNFLNALVNKYGLNAKRIGLIYDNSEYGKGVSGTIKKRLAGSRFEIVADLPVTTPVTDYTSHILRIRNAKPDVIMFAQYYQDVVLTLRAMDSLNYKPVILGCASGFSDSRLPNDLGVVVSRRVFSGAVFGPIAIGMNIKYAPLQKFYKKAIRAGIKFGGKGYDVNWFMLGAQVVYVYKEALEKARSAKGKDINDAILKLKIPRGSDSLIAPFYNPALEWDKTGKPLNQMTPYIQWQNGKMVMVYPEDSAEAKPRLS